MIHLEVEVDLQGNLTQPALLLSNTFLWIKQLQKFVRLLDQNYEAQHILLEVRIHSRILLKRNGSWRVPYLNNFVLVTCKKLTCNKVLPIQSKLFWSYEIWSFYKYCLDRPKFVYNLINISEYHGLVTENNLCWPWGMIRLWARSSLRDLLQGPSSYPAASCPSTDEHIFMGKAVAAHSGCFWNW